MPNVLVAVSHHGAAAIPPFTSHDVHFFGKERVRRAHNGADIEIMRQVFNRHMECVPARIKIRNDRVESPIPILIDHIAGVAMLQ